MDLQRELQLLPSKQVDEDIAEDNSKYEADPEADQPTISVAVRSRGDEITHLHSTCDGHDAALQLSIGFYTTDNGHEQEEQQSNAAKHSQTRGDCGQVMLSLGRGRGAKASHDNPMGDGEETEAETSASPFSFSRQAKPKSNWSDMASGQSQEVQIMEAGAELVKQQAREQLKLASAEKAYAEHARELAKRQVELAEAEFASAKRIREQAQAELNRAQLLKEQATRRIDATCMEITCHACRQHFQYNRPPHSPSASPCPPPLELPASTSGYQAAQDENRNYTRQLIAHDPASVEGSAGGGMSNHKTYFSLQLTPQADRDRRE